MPELSFAAQITDLPGLDDSDFLKALTWDRSCGAAIRTAAAEGNVTAFCRAWQASRRNSDAGTAANCGCAERALWSEHAFPEEAGLAGIIHQVAQSAAKKPSPKNHRPVNKPAINWSQRVSLLVTELTNAVSSAEQRPFAMIAALEFLVHSGHRLANDSFFKLWRATLSELLMWPTISHADPTVPADIVAVELGEIPFVGGLYYREIAFSFNLIKSGRRIVSDLLVNGTDTDGTPHAEIVPRLPFWLAPIVRSSLMMERFQQTGWNADQRQLLTDIVERAILLCRPDGQAALTNGMKLDAFPVLSCAVENLNLGLVSSTSDYLQSIQRVVSGKPPKRARTAVTTMSSNQSDWAKFAFLRSDLSISSDSVAIAHHQSFPQLDVTAMGKPLIHGDWSLKLKLADAEVELAEEWSCVCWQSDPDADYIELQMTGPGKLRVERLIMLSRRERFLVIADSVSGVTSDSRAARSENGNRKPTVKPRIEYESRLSICDGLTGESEGVTREARIQGKKLKARVFPLALPQDCVNSTPHSLKFEGNQLVLKQIAEGDGLFAPMVFVWHPERTRVDAIWRMLTVTEEGKVVAPDAAVGYRLKLGKYQLLISRALKKTGNSRACLGHHTFNETVIAKFDSNGNVDPILMVE